MSFFEEEKSGQRGKQFKSWDETMVRFTPDYPVTVQIVEPSASDNYYWQHYIPNAKRSQGGRGVPVRCPGIDVCPICQRNKDLERDHPDYIGASKRWFVNVLDLTPRRECPLCENNTYAKLQCDYCDTSLAEVEPSPPTVKLMERGKEFFDHLKVIDISYTKPYDPNDTTLDRDVYDYSTKNPGEDVPVGITHYEIKVITDSYNRKPVPTRNSEANDRNWRDYVDDYVSEEDAYIFLGPEEIKQLLTGQVTLSEILKARYQQENEDEILNSF